MQANTKRSFWGWGLEQEALDSDEIGALARRLRERFGLPVRAAAPIPRADALELSAPRLGPPAGLAHLLSADARDRAGHTYGKAFRDIVRGLAGDFNAAPDWVARPGSEQDLVDLLDWAGSARVAVIPYGGGSSVVGGVEARLDSDWAGAVSVDMARFDALVEIDPTSRAAHLQAGLYGPALEAALKPHGLTLRHYPQSFEFSTLGGWLATRAAGHFATRYTHIEDLVESVRVLTPSGLIETRRLPGSGAGPSPDRFLLGSEGTLGFFLSAWMRLQARPEYRAGCTAAFETFAAGTEAVRQLSQSGLDPSNCRLIDATEAVLAGIGDGSRHLLILGFESADHPIDPWLARAVEICRGSGGQVMANKDREKDPASDWRSTFLRAPYMRDGLVRLGMIVETFETAVTWDRFEATHAAIVEAVQSNARRLCGGAAVGCRFTHVYPDGPAPYYTVVAPGRDGAMVEQWDEIKQATMAAIDRSGATVTHHHAVGRDHRPGYDRQRPPLFADALRAVKQTLDPASVLNPGVLIDRTAVRQ
ncbi:MAG: FAD-binding oxidoreductase [Pseudomonadota bacterium]|nr:MAG: FAD-binding oxidoreductase [Pseudomonadota bacterium]